MATILIQNGFFTGALGAILSGRAATSSTGTDYASPVAAALAFAGACITANAALSVPMADADNAQIGQLCEQVAAAILNGRACTSSTAADYATVAAAAVACAKQAEPSLTA